MPSRPRFEFLDNNDAIIAFAHRGGDASGPEKKNSMAAFEAAYRLGYRYFETDVVASADGVVMATHGSKNKRAAKKNGGLHCAQDFRKCRTAILSKR